MRETAILFLAHSFAPWIARRFERIWTECSGIADCHVLLQDDHGRVRDAWTSFLGKRGMGGALVTFDASQLEAELGYRYFVLRGHVLGSAHLPLLPFARRSEHRRIWRIEYDVEYRGSWKDLVLLFERNPAALLATQMQARRESPAWTHWKTLSAPEGEQYLPEHALKAFFPISRFDRAAIRVIDEAHRNGWSGHYEALVPTVIARAGLQVHDLLLGAPCYLPGEQVSAGDLSRLSTMRWRPEVQRDEFLGRGQGPLLFHPVKGQWCFDGRKVVAWKVTQAPGTSPDEPQPTA